jgi:hypothetical protein
MAAGRHARLEQREDDVSGLSGGGQHNQLGRRTVTHSARAERAQKRGEVRAGGTRAWSGRARSGSRGTIVGQSNADRRPL